MGAKSEPPKDKREYIRLSVDLPEHPKLVQLDEEIIPLAGWLLVTAFAYCGKNLTDGEFVPGVIYRKACVDPEIGKHLIAAGLWHEAGHDCPKCPQPGDRKLISHDYLEHQRSKEEAQTLRSARSDAGAKGAEKRWAAKRAADAAKVPDPDSGMAKAMALAIANGSQVDGKPMAEEEVEEEELHNPPTGGLGGRGASTAPGDASQQAAPPKKKRNVGTRLPDGWLPPPKLVEEMRIELPDFDTRAEHPRFVDHWRAATGRTATKLDWEATWRNWMRTANDRLRPRGGNLALVPAQGQGLWDREIPRD